MSSPGARVYAALSAASGVTDLVSTRIRALYLVQEETLPAIVYTMVGGARDGSLAGDGGLAHPRVRVDAYASDADDAYSVQAAVRDALSDALGAVGDEPTETWDPDPLRVRVMADYVFPHHDDD